MIGTLDPAQRKVSIVGAGISGLLIGYSLKKQGYQVQIFEATSRVGGLIQTKTTPFGIAETAAHSMLVSEKVETFLRQLGVELISVNPKSKARFILRDEKMRKLPLSFFELIQTLKHFFSKPKLLSDPLSLQDWGNAYVGQAATQYLLSPFVSGVFACSPAELNAELAFPALVPHPASQSLFRWLRHRSKNHKSAPRPQMKTLKYGLQDLVNRLAQELEGCIHLNHPIDSLTELQGNVVLTVPTQALAKLIHTFDPTSFQALQKISYAPLVSATTFYRSTDFKHPPRGVGVLIPASERKRILGCLFNSSAFSDRVSSPEYVSLTVMMGGTRNPDALNLSDQEIKDLIDVELRSLLKAHAPPLHLEIVRWARAIPIFSNWLKDAQNSLKTGFCSTPGKIVFSNFSSSVSIRSLIESLT